MRLPGRGAPHFPDGGAPARGALRFPDATYEIGEGSECTFYPKPPPPPPPAKPVLWKTFGYKKNEEQQQQQKKPTNEHWIGIVGKIICRYYLAQGLVVRQVLSFPVGGLCRKHVPPDPRSGQEASELDPPLCISWNWSYWSNTVSLASGIVQSRCL
ncbi:hypothetical protein H8959_008234, partial [Pygathrix nigripes]